MVNTTWPDPVFIIFLQPRIKPASTLWFLIFFALWFRTVHPPRTDALACSNLKLDLGTYQGRTGRQGGK